MAFAVAVAAIRASDWSRKAFALTWPVVGLYLGAVAGRLLGQRGERALSAWREWSAWEAVPENEPKRLGSKATTTVFGLWVGLTLSFGLVAGWPYAGGVWMAALHVAVLVPAIGRWAGTSSLRVAIICVGSFLLCFWYWDSITYPAMPMRTFWVLGISTVFACAVAFPFVWNLFSARRRASGPRSQAPKREGDP